MGGTVTMLLPLSTCNTFSNLATEYSKVNIEVECKMCTELFKLKEFKHLMNMRVNL